MIKKKKAIKMIEKFDKKRKRLIAGGKWTYPLADDWKEKTLSNLDTAISFLNSKTVRGMLPPRTALTLEDGAIAPNAEISIGDHIPRREIKLNPYYILAAAGTLFSDKDLKFNHDSLLLTMAHERNHWKTRTFQGMRAIHFINPLKAQFAQYCEEVRADLLGIRDYKAVTDATTDYCQELMAAREGFEEDSNTDNAEHPSRAFRVELSECEWNETTIKRVYEHLKDASFKEKKRGWLKDKYIGEMSEAFDSFTKREKKICISDSLRCSYKKEAVPYGQEKAKTVTHEVSRVEHKKSLSDVKKNVANKEAENVSDTPAKHKSNGR